MARLSLRDVPEYSTFVKRTLQAMAFGGDQFALLESLAARRFTREDFEQCFASLNDPDELSVEMRKMRRQVMVSIIARDVTGVADLDEVVETITALAESTVTHAVRVHSRHLARRFGVPTSQDGRAQDLLVVAMGKLGGGELNVSSDIDLVFLYDESGQTQATPEFPNASRFVSNHEFFERLSKRVIPAISDLDGYGFVFRVDMRLRPFGDSGPIVVSTEMLEEYLYTEGRDWERFAWLKGRIVNEAVFSKTQDFEQAKKTIASLVRPFVFRKYVDFTAINALSRVHKLIRAESTRKEVCRGGTNVKLGRGGIREIEFITQTFQIINGGREPTLRARSTRPMLRELAHLGIISEENCRYLSEDYVFLRNLEHAIQYVDDQQTQLLPDDPQGQERIARMVGMTREQLLERLETTRSFVSETFDGIFHIHSALENESGWPVGWDDGTPSGTAILADKFSELGYADSASHASRITKLMGSRLLASRSDDARDQFSLFLRTIAENAIDWASQEKFPVTGDEVFSRYMQLLEVVAGRPTYVALLNQYPKVARKVSHLLAASRWAADYLVAHPLILDELVDERIELKSDDSEVNWSGWSARLRAAIADCDGDQERELNLLRDAHHSALFRLLVSDIDGNFSVERLADQLSALADAVMEIVIEVAWKSLRTRHCEVPRFAVLGYGKYGGKELQYASDLDVVFIYDDPDPMAEMNYAKLVRRMMNWLTMQTSSGILFEIDMRLRPNGDNGLIACSFDQFCRYQENADGRGAWLWEHQALTRARFCAGDKDLGERFEAERNKILAMDRSDEKTALEVNQMRKKMLDGHPNNSGLFDVKHDRGGMVDVEFSMQYLVLTQSRHHAQLLRNLGNTKLLKIAADAGLLDADLASRAASAYRGYRNIQRSMRLAGGDGVKARIPVEQVESDRDTVLELWRTIFHTDGPQR